MRVHKCECGCGELIFEEENHRYKSFVNHAHRQAAYRHRKRAIKNAAKVTGIRRRCMNCGVEFLARTDRHIFHSDSCRVSYWQQMKRLEQEKQP